MRPERISKLIGFLRDKEPLMYLFLLNANYENVEAPNFIAGVSLKNGITVAYSNELLKMPINEFYFVMVHEAQHIFKQHPHIFKKEYQGKDQHERLLMNIANDAMINYEISKFDFSYFKELSLDKVFIDECMMVEREFDCFLSEKRVDREDGYTSLRYFNWLKDNKAKARQEDGKTFMKIKGSSEKEYSNTDDFDGEEGYGEGKPEKGEGEEKDQDGDGDGDGDQDVFMTPTEVKNMLDRMLDQASKMEEQLAGKGAGSMSKKTRTIKKSAINWKSELRKRINYYLSKNGSRPTKKKSYLTYLSNPKSIGNMIFKGNMRQRHNLETAVILALDTSGSCFYNEQEVENFFTEIDTIAKELEQNKKGGVYVMQWDWEVQGDIVKYNKGDYKNFEMKGGGGTYPQSIFNFLSSDKCLTQKGNNFVFKNGDLEIEVEGVKKLPLVVVLTDGYFGSFSRTGIYETCRNVLFFTKETRSIVDGTDCIVYK